MPEAKWEGCFLGLMYGYRVVVGVVLLVLLCKPKGRNVVVLESLEAIMGSPDEKRIDIFLVVCV